MYHHLTITQSPPKTWFWHTEIKYSRQHIAAWARFIIPILTIVLLSPCVYVNKTPNGLTTNLLAGLTCNPTKQNESSVAFCANVRPGLTSCSLEVVPSSANSDFSTGLPNTQIVISLGKQPSRNEETSQTSAMCNFTSSDRGVYFPGEGTHQKTPTIGHQTGPNHAVPTSIHRLSAHELAVTKHSCPRLPQLSMPPEKSL